MLCQLSYIHVVTTGGLEPPTPAVSERCSSQAELRRSEKVSAVVERSLEVWLSVSGARGANMPGFAVVERQSRQVNRGNARIRTEDAGVRARNVSCYATFPFAGFLRIVADVLSP